MGRRANNPNEFQQASYDIADMLKQPPVENEAVWGAITAMEAAGTNVMAEGIMKKEAVAKTFRGVLLKLPDVDIIPPLSEDQLSQLQTKISLWGHFIEAAEKPAARDPKPSQPRNTGRRKY